MVIPAQRGGVLFGVGGCDGELYVNGHALTQQWADELRAKVPDLSSDVDRLQVMRAEWLDVPPEDRTLALADGCTDRTATPRTERRLTRGRLLAAQRCGVVACRQTGRVHQPSPPCRIR
jgi:hypothetical protein